MLHLYVSRLGYNDGFLSAENYIYNPPAWFDGFCGEDYIQGEKEKAIIKDIDKSDVLEQGLLYNPVFGYITPSQISGTSKTLILLNNVPNMYFNGTAMGNNAVPWLLNIGKTKDIYVCNTYPLQLEGCFELEIVNTGIIVHNLMEYYEQYLTVIGEQQ